MKNLTKRKKLNFAINLKKKQSFYLSKKNRFLNKVIRHGIILDKKNINENSKSIYIF